VYTVANYLAFFVFGVIGHYREESFNSLRGLSKQNTLLSVALAAAMFSLAGIPPLAGFFGKFHLFFSGATAGHYLVVAFAVLNNILALYYYLQVIKSAWVDEPEGELGPIRMVKRQRFAIIALMVATLLLGILPYVSNNVFTGFTF
ncbi:MAG: NADH-quinone oxidoreductase subunit N, partial [Fibrobacter sp.]|nr:NADH-quinone oxidoreductase subunit N [Fibrobacter sp.]